MSTGGILLALAFLIGAAVFIMWPVVMARQSESKQTGSKSDFKVAVSGNNADEPSKLALLQSEHDAVLLALRDLDFDYQTGKFTETDYQSQREHLVQRGIELLRQIDTTKSEAIEQAVQMRRSV